MPTTVHRSIGSSVRLPAAEDISMQVTVTRLRGQRIPHRSTENYVPAVRRPTGITVMFQVPSAVTVRRPMRTSTKQVGHPMHPITGIRVKMRTAMRSSPTAGILGRRMGIVPLATGRGNRYEKTAGTNHT